MKSIFVILLLTLSFIGWAQNSSNFKDEICKYQSDQNAKFKDPKTSPLLEKDLPTFKGLDFFKPNPKFRIEAQFVRAKDAKPFEMPTTTDRLPIYFKYGDLKFSINGKHFSLEVYQSPESLRNPLYRNKVFLPFKDLTNGKQTYSGGRFIYMDTPKGSSAILDFNKAFNPLCAYNYKYSCPIVPKKNYLDVKIKAGVKKYH